MASLGKINHNNKRKEWSNADFARRQELKKQIKNPDMPMSEKLALIHKLDKNPNKSKVRYRRRCLQTGRPRGIMMGEISRHEFRRAAVSGMLPGIKKSSW